jgi:hypothetical protein
MPRGIACRPLGARRMRPGIGMGFRAIAFKFCSGFHSLPKRWKESNYHNVPGYIAHFLDAISLIPPDDQVPGHKSAAPVMRMHNAAKAGPALLF